MKKKINTRSAKQTDLRREDDFSKLKNGVRGKYLAGYQAGTNLVLLSPEVMEFFGDEQSVNAALRSLIRVSKRSRRN